MFLPSRIKTCAFGISPTLSPNHVIRITNFQTSTSLNVSPRSSTTTMVSRPPGSSSSTTCRRTFLNFLLTPLLLPFESLAAAAEEPYDPIKSRRYIDTGRPKPDAEPPKFSSSIPTFALDDNLRAQDIKQGQGDTISTESLVVCRWLVQLDDGTTIDDNNLKLPAIFRPGAHQVPPGIEDSVIGMRAKGERRVSGSAERILTKIDLGYDIGERSLVPNGSTLYLELYVDAINPYGEKR